MRRRMRAQVVQARDLRDLRYLMRLNAEIGSAKNANIRRLFRRRQNRHGGQDRPWPLFEGQSFTTFMAIVPADKPKYLFFMMMDEPQGFPELTDITPRRGTPAPSPARSSTRVGPLLGIEPRFDPPAQPFPLLAQLGYSAANSAVVLGRPLMRLGDLLPEAPFAEALAAREIAGLSADSRAVDANFAFFALAGSKADGAGFAAQAVARGAVAVIGRATLLTLRQRFSLKCRMYAGRWRSPRRVSILEQPETIVAITGTSGKTSVAAFTRQIWLALGHRAASLGTHRPRRALRRSLWLADDAGPDLAAQDAR